MTFEVNIEPDVKNGGNLGYSWNSNHPEKGFSMELSADSRSFGPITVHGIRLRKDFTQKEAKTHIVKVMKMIGYEVPEDLKDFDNDKIYYG